MTNRLAAKPEHHIVFRSLKRLWDGFCYLVDRHEDKVLAFILLLLIAMSLIAPSEGFPATYTYDTKADWDDLYETDADALGGWGRSGRSQIDLNYHRFTQGHFQRQFGIAVYNILGWNSSTRAAIYHCGFCWVIETLEDELSIARAVGIQQSTYIQSAKFDNEDADIRPKVESSFGLAVNDPFVGDSLSIYNALRVNGAARSLRPTDILNESLDTNESRGNVRTILGGPGYEIVSWEILSSLTDAEIVALGANFDRMTNGRKTHVVFVGTHISVCSPTPCFTFRSIARLKELLPGHGFINRQTQEYTP